MRLLVVSYYDDVWVPLVEDLCRTTGWQVSDWFVAYASRDSAISHQRAFPKAVIHQPEDASRGLLPQGMRGHALPVLDQDILAKMAPYERMFMRMLDIYDPTGRAFTGRERREAYYDLLRFGLSIIHERKPDLFLAATIPHSLHDYMLYCLCKLHGIDTLTYVAFTIPGYMLLHSSLEEGNPVLAAAYQRKLGQVNGADVALPPQLERYYGKVRADYADGEPWYVKLRDHSLLVEDPFCLRIQRAKRQLGKWVRFATDLLRGPGRAYYEHFVRPLSDFLKQDQVLLRDSVTTKHEAEKVFRKGMRVKRQLLAQYRVLQREPDLNRPFLYVPLHYQPEASTAPLGGSFIDQILMIQLLARFLPSGWVIYVKEQKTIFDPELRGQFSRDAHYYQQIVEISNTVLVPMHYASFALIDRAKAVATVTGTAGWEGVVRGVPAIVFGNAWYRDCHGVFDGRSAGGCASALDAIKAGYTPDPHKVKLFLQTVSEVGVYADRDSSYILTELTLEQSQTALVQHLLREYPKMTDKLLPASQGTGF